MPENPWAGWFEEEPRPYYDWWTNYLSKQTNLTSPSNPYHPYWGPLQRAGVGSQNFTNWSRNQYDPMYNKYKADIAGQIVQQGQPSSMTFQDWLLNKNTTGGYNLANNPVFNQWNALAPWSKGEMKEPRGFWNLNA